MPKRSDAEYLSEITRDRIQPGNEPSWRCRYFQASKAANSFRPNLKTFAGQPVPWRAESKLPNRDQDNVAALLPPAKPCFWCVTRQP